MKKQNFLKVFILSAAMMAGLLLPTSMSAQKSDGFFRGGETEIYENREEFIIDGNTSGGLQNDAIGDNLPIGNGLIILSIAGAGYLLSKRKRSFKANATLLVTFAMLLGLTQCKKKIEPVQPDNSPKVSITLDVSGGSKVGVDPYNNTVNAPVTYEDGDIVHVGVRHNNQYVYGGALTYNGEVFRGDLDVTPDEDSRLYFYFLGGYDIDDAEFYESDLDGAEVYYLRIMNQTSRYPVISFAGSNQPYQNQQTVYTAKLENKCAIVKFTVDNEAIINSSSEKITIAGVNNFVKIDFANPQGDDNGFSYHSSFWVHDVYDGQDLIDETFDGQGFIRMSHRDGHPEGEYWAIMLPQDAVEEGNCGSAYSNNFVGNRPAIPEIQKDRYMPEGIAIDLDQEYPINAYSIGSGRKVIFSSGNLQYQAASSSKGNWRFAPSEWDIIGTQVLSIYNGTPYTNVDYGDNYYISDSYNGWIDLFGYGTGLTPTNTTYYDQDDYNNEYEWHEWGTNMGSEWFTLTADEWKYLLCLDPYPTALRYEKFAAATVNGAHGMVILPDKWVLPDNCSFEPGMENYWAYYNNDGTYDWTTSNVYTSGGAMNNWNDMKAAGAVFLPAAGDRQTTSEGALLFSDINVWGRYWSSSVYNVDNALASYMMFTDDVDVEAGVGQIEKYYGHSVRLVRDITSSDK